MGIISYALFTYALTAVISFAVIGVIVVVSKMMSAKNSEGGQ